MTPPTTPPAPPSSPRAFTQGAGLVFQVAGCTLFLVAMFLCCGSAFLDRQPTDLTHLTFLGVSAQRAISISLFVAIFFGIGLAGVGLGMQAEHRPAPLLAVTLTCAATLFWLFDLCFAIAVRSIPMALLCFALTGMFSALFAIALAAFREMRANPTETRHDILPADYKIPYSHYHADPPEVRLAAELEARRQRLAVQQKELEALEAKLKNKPQNPE